MDAEITWFRTSALTDTNKIDHIRMKLGEQAKKCPTCNACKGNRCDIYTTCKEEMGYAKHLMTKDVQQNYMYIKTSNRNESEDKQT